MLWISAALAWAAPSTDGPDGDGYEGDPTIPLRYSLSDSAPLPEHDPESKLVHESVAIRLRSLVVPRAILDQWYTDDIDETWPYTEPRPHLSGTGFALEYSRIRRRSTTTFYAEYVDVNLTGGYWDRRRAPEDPLDGRYLAPGAGLGIVAVGGDYGFSINLVPAARTGGVFSLSALVQGGLGLAVLVGRMDRWIPDEQGNPAYDQFLAGLPPDRGAVPRVFPVVDATVGLRMNFGSALVWQVDAGLHTAFTYGTSLGVIF